MRPAEAGPVLLVGAVLASAFAPSAVRSAEPDERPWSPETATLIYSSEGEIWRRDGADGTPRNLTRDEALDLGGAFSPDGSTILVQSLRSGDREVWIMNADGSNPRNLSGHPASDLLAEWLPDGERILFFSTRGEKPGDGRPFPGNLWSMAPDGSDQRRVTREPLTSSFGPDVSPDGRRALTARSFGDDLALVEVDLATGAERRLTAAGRAYGGRYSPDGRRIAFHEEDGGEAHIVVMEADGTDRRTLTHGARHYSPTWSPDGRWLLFSAAPLDDEAWDLLAIPVDGGTPVPIVATEADERYGRWAPAAVPRGR